LSALTSATAAVILAHRSSTFADKGGKYTLSLTNSHKESLRGLK
jgi:hypothetical protein